MTSQLGSFQSAERGAVRTASKRVDTLWNDDERDTLKSNMKKLAEKLMQRFGKVQTAFRAFDMRIRGKVSFSDFAYVLD